MIDLAIAVGIIGAIYRIATEPNNSQWLLLALGLLVIIKICRVMK